MRCFVALFCMALAGCGASQFGSTRIDPALSMLVPADTTLLAGVRMEDLRATLWYKKTVGAKSMAILDDFAKETGLDLRTDVWELLIVSDGAKTAVLARGKFAPQGQEPRIDRPGLTRTPYKGRTLIGNDQGAVVFMNSTTAVAGLPAAVLAIIDQRDRSTGPSALLRQKLNELPPHSQIWLVAAGGFGKLSKEVPQSGNLANMSRILSMLESITAAADLRSGLQIAVAGVCRSEQDARSLGDALRGLVGLARLNSPPNEPDLLRAYDAIQVGLDQRTVRLNVALSQELLDKAQARFSGPGSNPVPRR